MGFGPPQGHGHGSQHTSKTIGQRYARNPRDSLEERYQGSQHRSGRTGKQQEQVKMLGHGCEKDGGELLVVAGLVAGDGAVAGEGGMLWRVSYGTVLSRRRGVAETQADFCWSHSSLCYSRPDSTLSPRFLDVTGAIAIARPPYCYSILLPSFFFLLEFPVAPRERKKKTPHHAHHLR